MEQGNTDLNREGIGVTGMGIVSSIGQDVSTFTRSLLEGKSGIGCSESFSGLSFPLISAEVKNFVFEEALSRFKELPNSLISRARDAGRRAPLVIQASLIAALEAWQSAGLHEDNVDPDRIGLVVAGHNTTERYKYNLYAKFQEEAAYLSPAYALHFMDSDQVGTVSEVFNIRGEGFTIGAASATGNIGIIQGYRLIRQGLIDCCLVVGVMADLSPMELQGFYNTGALGGRSFQDNPAASCRPFDEAREGFIWGQGGGCLILEGLGREGRGQGRSSLQDRSRMILGEIIGTAVGLDANRRSDPALKGEARVMRQAMVDAGLKPSDIDYLNAHGTSSILGDETEIAAIRQVFGDHVRRMWINSTKSLTGHCLYSAGIVEAIATLAQLDGGFVHGNPNLDAPIDQECLFAPNQSKRVCVNIGLSNSFGFGGINSSIVFRKGK